MAIYRPILIEKQNDEGDWEEFFRCHATVNKNTTDSERLSSGATRIRSIKNFDVRYSKKIAEIDLDTQYFRIVYQGVTYSVTSYDDYFERHVSVRLVGALYGS